jgi:hypothetical protein
LAAVIDKRKRNATGDQRQDKTANPVHRRIMRKRFPSRVVKHAKGYPEKKENINGGS